jgi:DNA-binding MarR family transcriptional regulator
MMPNVPPRLSPADCTCFRVRGAARRVTQIYDRHLAPAGISITQFAILSHVAVHGPLALGRLADMLNTDRTTLSRNVRPLIAGGLLESATVTDRRRRDLAATAAGRALFKQALPFWSEAERTVRATLGAPLVGDLHGTLERSMEKLAAL